LCLEGVPFAIVGSTCEFFMLKGVASVACG
jgi:hypothetical protein